MNRLTDLKAYSWKMPYNQSNKKIYDYIVSVLNSDSNTKLIEIASKLKYVNIETTLETIYPLLVENNMIDPEESKFLNFKRNIQLVRGDAEILKTSIKAEFYSLLLIENYWKEYFENLNLNLSVEIYFKIRQNKMFHNFHIFYDGIIRCYIIYLKKSVRTLTIIKQIETIDNFIEKAENLDYLNGEKFYNEHIAFLEKYKKNLFLKLQYAPKKKIKIKNLHLDLDSKDTNDLIRSSLKKFLSNDSQEILDKLLLKEVILEKIIFNGNQNRLVEFFKRLHYHNKILNPNKTQIRDWLVTNFNYKYVKGKNTEIRELNPYSVYDLLTKGKGEPQKGSRIFNNETLPHKPHHLIT